MGYICDKNQNDINENRENKRKSEENSFTMSHILYSHHNNTDIDTPEHTQSAWAMALDLLTWNYKTIPFSLLLFRDLNLKNYFLFTKFLFLNLKLESHHLFASLLYRLIAITCQYQPMRICNK